MKKAVIIAAVLIAAVIVGANIWKMSRNDIQPAESTAIQTWRVSKQELKRSVIASGIAVPAEEEKIYLDGTLGQVERLLVTPGQQVKPGTPLLRYRADDIAKQLEELEIARKRLDLELEELRHEKDQLMANFREQAASLEAGADPSEAAKATALKKQDLERQEQSLLLDYEANRNEIASLEAKRSQMIVASRIGGTVQKVAANPNEAGESPLVHIVSDRNYLVQGAISEFDYVLVKPGMQVEVKPKAMDGISWKGIVRSVDSIPEGADLAGSSLTDNEQAVTLYPFTVELTEKSEELKYGYHVYIDIEVESGGNRLVVPHQAVMEEDGKRYVYAVEQGLLRKREVVVGDSNDSWKEIVSGLSEGDTIAAHAAPDLKDGMPVRAEEES
ncbi:efflux RND transporter periplasmic adaptor subunit [Paenibacillus thailandensis]|uniref:Efflux RND transporter periplasmic adaptor subunit n=1 Tax=Paenibacillus thailandensis TaxID=393250 RepID=A0ABW5R0Y2_9BACL